MLAETIMVVVLARKDAAALPVHVSRLLAPRPTGRSLRYRVSQPGWASQPASRRPPDCER